jgi:ABC-type multidrug transport system fused ATPase/permease subunit
MCDEVWVMSEGKIVETGVPEELINRESGLFNFMNSKNK